MSEIRVGYSGLISLIIGLLGTVLGMIFVLIVTRTVSPLEYGTWGLIGGLVLYAGVVEPIISVWVLREVARGVESGKTAILSGGLFSILGISIYLISAFFVGAQIDADQNILYLGLILIPAIFLNRIMTAVNSAWKPQAASYGQLVFGITEIVLATIFVYFLNLGVPGIIFTVTGGFLVSALTQIIFGRSKLKNHFMKQSLKKWIKLFWLALYPTLAGIILYFDVAIFSVITGSVVGLAYWTAAFAITGMITGVGLIMRPTYSKLLYEGEGKNFLSENLRQLFYFGIPIVSLVIVFAHPGLFILNPLYVLSIPIVVILSVQVFLGVMNRNFQEMITGIEKVDMDENSTFKDYVKSKLFFMPTLLLIKNSIYVILLAIGLFLILSNSLIEQLVFWALISLFAQIPFTIYVYIIMKKELKTLLDSKSIFKYLIVSFISFGISYVLMQQFLVYVNDIFTFIPNLLLFVGFGIGLYFTITYFVDKKTRILVKAIIQEIIKK